MSDILIRVSGGVGRITLNRPRAINALSDDMLREMGAALTAWAQDPTVHAVLLDGAGERGLCAGGDIRSIYQAIQDGTDGPIEFWREEYLINALIANYPKPYVVFMDGLVMGGGVGVSAHGSVRVVTERSAIGMPEVSIGFIPDVGGTYLLSRAPGELGTHLGLTGGRVGAADAILLGLADQYLPSAALAELAELPADELLVQIAARAEVPPAGQFAADREWIDSCYAADSVEQILDNLLGSGHPAAEAAAKEIQAKAPTAVKVTLRALRTARGLATLEDCLNLEHRLVSRFLTAPDLGEGIRAAVIDKDRNPTWRPATLAEVDDAAVESYFLAQPGQQPVFGGTA
ncbi:MULTISPECIES: enoyl-CoA hydratase/isomerase family protein [unclassified Crossiella]|uniref:enoyl-CoA hydratase/isomerase family protein n=1 Tax=unclassified Crossiella TaxID=2620835 RepID=UPI001FFF03E2|nr:MULTISPECIES: enoyl-CoA hydratase/isomerase family protein [unclassified Crossiella]MCK2239883.1 enoyl-CoA hydratase/isomerase family protein [Crossiella sp. S99.2]MCK2252591.1 enoyl-CoA hydratase/isomerase family protein [Crossiella sp. S99.1]